MADAFTIHGTEVPLSKLGSTGTMDAGQIATEIQISSN